MELLRLGHVGLTAAEAALVATLFRLHGIDRNFTWTLASVPPFDALLADANCPDAEIQRLSGARTCAMRLEKQGVRSDGLMQRPIRSDRLLKWLDAIELDLLSDAGDSLARKDHPSRRAQPTVAPQRSSPTAPTEAAQIVVARPLSLQSVGWELRSEGTEYKLKRWPAASLATRDVAKVRVATLISRRAMSLREVSDISRIPAERCEEFLLEWAQMDLLLLGDPTRQRSHDKLSAGAKPRPDLASPSGFGASLIRSIRSRFGII